jgi:CRISPR/Cas system CMR-associated protein Cmr5 small subunit
MKNLEQIRARNALKAAREKGSAITGGNDGEVVKKVSPLIINHGLLATVAYSFDEKKTGWKILFNCMAEHLADPGVDIIPKEYTNRDGLMEYLTGSKSDSEILKAATTEAMAWLSYMRRFVEKPQKR